MKKALRRAEQGHVAAIAATGNLRREIKWLRSEFTLMSFAISIDGEHLDID